MVTVFINNS